MCNHQSENILRELTALNIALKLYKILRNKPNNNMKDLNKSSLNFKNPPYLALLL